MVKLFEVVHLYILITMVQGSEYLKLSTSSSLNTAQRTPGFTLGSLVETFLHPIVSAGSNNCETLKRFLGLTYDQLIEKHMNLNETLYLDLITKKGKRKYGMKVTKSLMSNSESIIIIIHGFLESSEGLMVQSLAPVLLNNTNQRIFALDGRNAITLEYFRATTYVRFIGERLGKFLSEIVNNNRSAKNITLIGHSLGAHIAGIAGKTFNTLTGQLLGRIIALDPAGPCFSNVSLASRLDRSDADRVDVIHTSGAILGLNEPVGDYDYYPNGGIAQPGCYLSMCDHTRAWEYFVESVENPNNFPAYLCDSWTSYQEGKCANNDISFIGLQQEQGKEGTYFLATAPSPPFGLGLTGKA